jgi:uncharacterized protein (UPF0254 family)
MNDTFDGARIHREELDREIDSLRMERLIESRAAARPGFAGRARAGLGRGLISIGTSLVGGADAAAAAASARSTTSSSGA